MTVTRLIIVGTLVLVSLLMVYKIIPGKSNLLVTNTPSQFPVVTGYNLDRQEFEFPRDFSGEFNLVFIPFQRYHQDIVDTWVPTAQKIEAEFPGFIYYELPTLASMSTLYRTFLNEGMRAGIPDTTARQRTITLYLDKEIFRAALDIPSENDVYLFLVDKQGKILWQSVGEFTEEKANSLLDFLRENSAPGEANIQ
jgi:hypothetical protein